MLIVSFCKLIRLVFMSSIVYSETAVSDRLISVMFRIFWDSKRVFSPNSVKCLHPDRLSFLTLADLSMFDSKMRSLSEICESSRSMVQLFRLDLLTMMDISSSFTT